MSQWRCPFNPKTAIKKEANGFVLIELVTTLVMIGFIGAFVGLFLLTGVNGFLSARRNAETALKAQFALDRISAELRHVDSVPVVPVANERIIYRNPNLEPDPDPNPTSTRRIRYDNSSQTIFFSSDSGGTEFPLLDQVTNFTLSLDYANINQVGTSEEIRAINIGFRIADVPRDFRLRIFPRALIPRPT